MRIAKVENPPAPRHLSKRSKSFWVELNTQFVFEPHDLERLRCACEQMDLVDECEAAIRKGGCFVEDRYGQARANPAIAVARDARTLLLRALRELAVDVQLPEETRVPRQARRYA